MGKVYIHIILVPEFNLHILRLVFMFEMQTSGAFLTVVIGLSVIDGSNLHKLQQCMQASRKHQRIQWSSDTHELFFSI